MLGKTIIVILHQVLEIVPYGNLNLMLAKEVTCSSGKYSRKDTGVVASVVNSLSGILPTKGHIKVG